jgi:hypothetical protein
MEALARIKQVNDLLVRRNVYLILLVIVVLWLFAHYNVYGWGLPLTDDLGHPLNR